ncbi:hypothetical protein BAUCODRAFT_64329 [Baudoinia panamericana UAMH 10762]|uniref:Mog1p/PsbP-like protein n=1 Tax=Baudoinia panamericana (strain UAMH 10762) TaxID=717646 RepID=M2M033_BAUPA|nr:uncharacterized protein BAUCODRAFT_64329 [Baudoinia panamericana UAMH 10762]EMD00343.1 hypothetical protein BAUCODRAFT_64329 [Baudoinia panamericana UAMH 10762]
MADGYRLTNLFGGAVQCPLPATFADVSEIRRVPDNQEVWLDTNGLTSVVFDILERVDGMSDVDALQFHLDDITEESGAEIDGEVTVLMKGEVRFQKQGTKAYGLLATSLPGEKQRGRDNEPDFVALLLLLVRLVEQATDLIITVNVPHVAGTYDSGEVKPEQGRYGGLLLRGLEIREKIIEGFQIVDWGLFGED